jgi:stalled ribosome alternative rescue factor ArfA
MTVTKAELDALRASLAKPEVHLTFTPDNAIETQIHTELFRQQQKRLKKGEQSLLNAQETLHNELKKMRSDSQNHDDFNGLSHTDAFNQRL